MLQGAAHTIFSRQVRERGSWDPYVNDDTRRETLQVSWATFALNEMSQSKPGDMQILPPAAGTHITSICFLISFIMLRYK